ncbi:MAG: hypothetical protein RSB35_01535 [Eubacterium sp.]
MISTKKPMVGVVMVILLFCMGLCAVRVEAEARSEGTTQVQGQVIEVPAPSPGPSPAPGGSSAVDTGLQAIPSFWAHAPLLISALVLLLWLVRPGKLR